MAIPGLPGLIVHQGYPFFPLKGHLCRGAFAAIREDGTLIAWGHVGDGGDVTRIQNELDLL